MSFVYAVLPRLPDAVNPYPYITLLGSVSAAGFACQTLAKDTMLLIYAFPLPTTSFIRFKPDLLG